MRRGTYQGMAIACTSQCGRCPPRTSAGSVGDIAAVDVEPHGHEQPKYRTHEAEEVGGLALWRHRHQLFIIVPNERRSSFGFGGCDSCYALGLPLMCVSPPLHGLNSLGMVHAPSFRPRPRPRPIRRWRSWSVTSPIMPRHLTFPSLPPSWPSAVGVAAVVFTMVQPSPSWLEHTLDISGLHSLFLMLITLIRFFFDKDQYGLCASAVSTLYTQVMALSTQHTLEQARSFSDFTSPVMDSKF